MADADNETMTTGKQSGRVVVVTAGGENPWIMINALAARFDDIVVLEERPESKGLFLRRRARKLGWPMALGQLATMVASRFGKRFTRKRAQEILRHYGVSATPDQRVPLRQVLSINDGEAVSHLRQLAPEVVFLISCRMLKPVTLAQIPCPVVNFHAGINPRYRGLMGGYWARVSNDVANFGATVHLVDEGVDTGVILYQARQTPDRRDTMHTYPLLQTAASTDIVIAALDDALKGRLRPLDVAGPSQQWYHPPIWTWLWTGIRRGIW
ncbi:formyl transferase [Ensifer sp. HO-A22]|uniref:Formyl transferase n=1 Tax=Ensifer oleiphilus TaxID=2742698 RepID=A0A7Y6Q4K3_9HYPH|nr:formyl transferase [Ensifer oleiphilus]NVD38901.1 formyl transferase [Ensifer oleiphilus]